LVYVVLAVIYLLLLNIIATYRLSKSELTEKPQKVAQSILIWGLPLVGAVFISMFINEDEPVTLKSKNILLKILLFMFFAKIKKDKNQKKKPKGYSDTESPEDVYHASFQASASDL